jgi:hypothetical protein
MAEGSAPLPVCDIPNVVIIPVVLAYPALSENRPPFSTGLGSGGTSCGRTSPPVRCCLRGRERRRRAAGGGYVWVCLVFDWLWLVVLCMVGVVSQRRALK